MTLGSEIAMVRMYPAECKSIGTAMIINGCPRSSHGRHFPLENEYSILLAPRTRSHPICIHEEPLKDLHVKAHVKTYVICRTEDGKCISLHVRLGRVDLTSSLRPSAATLCTVPIIICWLNLVSISHSYFVIPARRDKSKLAGLSFSIDFHICQPQ